MAEGPASDLIAIQRDIEHTRGDITHAVADLERAVRDLVTVDHWKRAAGTLFETKPLVVLGIAFGLGFLVGRRFPRPLGGA